MQSTSTLPKRITRLGAALGTALSLCLTFASQASASVPGYQRVITSTADNSTSPKSLVASCPAGKQLIGTGSRIGSSSGGIGWQQTVLTAITPTTTSMTLDVLEDSAGTTFNWDVTASANCADPLSGLTVVSAVSVNSSLGVRGVTATCPTGKVVIAMGADINGGSGSVVLDGMHPDATLSSVAVSAFEDAVGTAANWDVTAYAICANSLSGLQLVSSTSANNSSNKSAQAVCPGSKVLLGSGFEINGAGGAVTALDYGPANNLTMTNTVTALEILSGTTSNWDVAAYAICADP